MITSEISLEDLGRKPFDDLITLHGNGTRTSTGTRWKVQYAVKMFTLIQDRDRDQDLLFPIVPVSFPLPLPVPCCVTVPSAIKKTAVVCSTL